ncbi:MAG: hypothetical protein ACREIA_08850, partial [Opitutaceae bacterium]
MQSCSSVLPRSRKRSRFSTHLFLLSLAGIAIAQAAHAQFLPSGLELTDLSLEELSTLNISAATKTQQPVFVTPAA